METTKQTKKKTCFILFQQQPCDKIYADFLHICDSETKWIPPVPIKTCQKITRLCQLRNKIQSSGKKLPHYLDPYVQGTERYFQKNDWLNVRQDLLLLKMGWRGKRHKSNNPHLSWARCHIIHGLFLFFSGILTLTVFLGSRTIVWPGRNKNQFKGVENQYHPLFFGSTFSDHLCIKHAKSRCFWKKLLKLEGGKAVKRLIWVS